MPRPKKSKPVAAAIEAAEHKPDAIEAMCQNLKPLTPEQLAEPSRGDAWEPPAVTPIDATFTVPTGAMVRMDGPPEHKPERKLRGTLGYHFAGGGSVQMTDTGSKLGIMFDLPEGKPPAEVLDCVRDERTFGSTVKRGLSYDAREKQWVKRVSDNPVGDRLEVEGRVRDAAERYRESKARQAEQGR